MLVSSKGKESIAPIHQVAWNEWVRLNDGGKGVGCRASNETDDKENLFVLLHSGIQLLGKVIGHIRHARLLLIATTQTALVLTCLLIILLFGIFAVSFAHIRAFITSVLFSLPFFLLLLEFLNTLLQNIWPEVPFKVRQLFCTCQTVFCCLLKYILVVVNNAL